MTVTDSRLQLEAALTTNGVRVMPQGSASPPSVFVIPASDWLRASHLGMRKRAVHWAIMCVVSAGSEVAITDQEALAEVVDVACRTLAHPWGLPQISSPGLLMLAGLPYIAFRAEIETLL